MVDELYELSSDIDIDMEILDIPLDMLKENIKCQIEDPTTATNYIEMINDKMDVLFEMYGEDPDQSQKVRDIAVNLYGFIINEICDRFEITHGIEFDNVENVKEYATALYLYLIIRFEKNIYKYTKNYIDSYKKDLAAEYASTSKRKDVTMLSIKRKKKNVNRDDVVILGNLHEIVDGILTQGATPEMFFSLSSGTSNYEASVLSDLFEGGILDGRFVDEYFQIALDNETLFERVKYKIIQKLS